MWEEHPIIDGLEMAQKLAENFHFHGKCLTYERKLLIRSSVEDFIHIVGNVKLL